MRLSYILGLDDDCEWLWHHVFRFVCSSYSSYAKRRYTHTHTLSQLLYRQLPQRPHKCRTDHWCLLSRLPFLTIRSVAFPSQMTQKLEFLLYHVSSSLWPYFPYTVGVLYMILHLFIVFFFFILTHLFIYDEMNYNQCIFFFFTSQYDCVCLRFSTTRCVCVCVRICETRDKFSFVRSLQCAEGEMTEFFLD